VARKTVLSTWEAGRYCRVSPYTVRHWVRVGRLKAYATPGGHRRIRLEDLNAFLKTHKMPLPKDFEEGKRRIFVLAHDARRICAEVRRLSPDLELRGTPAPFEAGLAVASLDPHVLVVDLDETAWDGLAICRALASSPEHSHVRLVGLSRKYNVPTLEGAERAGILAVFRRPLDPAEIRALLGEWFPSLKGLGRRR
jgi:excisionase family DNA binding protein